MRAKARTLLFRIWLRIKASVDLQKTWLFLVFVWIGIQDRVVYLFVNKRPETAHALNIGYAVFGWSIPCLVNKHLLASSVYLAQIGQYIGRRSCAAVFFVLAAFWLLCLIVGTQKGSHFIKTARQANFWTLMNILAFDMACIVWLTIAGLVSAPGANPGQATYGGAALWSFVCMVQISHAFNVDRTAKRRITAREIARSQSGVFAYRSG